MQDELYDPFTYDTLMAGTVLKFEEQPLYPLAGDINIYGPGIYCLVYTGDFEAYERIADGVTPIYAGKAVPPGSRRGDDGDTTAPALQDRIRHHKRSVDAAGNLDINDFSYRSFAIVPTWINLAERFLIQHYRPVWNRCLDGFGVNDPGRGRYNGERSWWDTLHPGRAWANNLVANKTVEDALERIELFIREAQPDDELDDGAGQEILGQEQLELPC